MFNFFTVLVLENGEMVYDSNTSSYRDLIQQLWLKDEKIDLVFAKIKILPHNWNIFSNPEPKNWYVKIDQSIKPNWFKKEYERKCLKSFFEEVYPKCIFVEKKDLVFKDRKHLFIKDSSVELYNSSAELYGTSSAKVYGLSSVKLYGSSSAELYHSASAELYDTSSAKVYGLSSVKLQPLIFD